MQRLFRIARGVWRFAILLVIVLCSIGIALIANGTIRIVISPRNFNTSINSPLVMPAMPAGLDAATMTRVVDGDTIDVQLNGKIERIRLLGINTQEANQCGFAEASARLKVLLTNRALLLEADPSQADRDRFGRLLRFIWRPDGTLVNYVMVGEGYAREYTFRRVPHKYATLFRAAARRLVVGC